MFFSLALWTQLNSFTLFYFFLPFLFHTHTHTLSLVTSFSVLHTLSSEFSIICLHNGIEFSFNGKREELLSFLHSNNNNKTTIIVIIIIIWTGKGRKGMHATKQRRFTLCCNNSTALCLKGTLTNDYIDIPIWLYRNRASYIVSHIAQLCKPLFAQCLSLYTKGFSVFIIHFLCHIASFSVFVCWNILSSAKAVICHVQLTHTYTACSVRCLLSLFLLKFSRHIIVSSWHGNVVSEWIAEYGMREVSTNYTVSPSTTMSFYFA